MSSESQSWSTQASVQLKVVVPLFPEHIGTMAEPPSAKRVRLDRRTPEEQVQEVIEKELYDFPAYFIYEKEVEGKTMFQRMVDLYKLISDTCLIFDTCPLHKCISIIFVFLLRVRIPDAPNTMCGARKHYHKYHDLLMIC